MYIRLHGNYPKLSEEVYGRRVVTNLSNKNPQKVGKVPLFRKFQNRFILECFVL